MSIKSDAINELDKLMKEFSLSPTRVGRDLFNNPSFYATLLKPETKVTDVTLDRIFRYVVELRGQRPLQLIVGKKAK